MDPVSFLGATVGLLDLALQFIKGGSRMARDFKHAEKEIAAAQTLASWLEEERRRLVERTTDDPFLEDILQTGQDDLFGNNLALPNCSGPPRKRDKLKWSWDGKERFRQELIHCLAYKSTLHGVLLGEQL